WPLLRLRPLASNPGTRGRPLLQTLRIRLAALGLLVRAGYGPGRTYLVLRVRAVISRGRFVFRPNLLLRLSELGQCPTFATGFSLQAAMPGRSSVPLMRLSFAW